MSFYPHGYRPPPEGSLDCCGCLFILLGVGAVLAITAAAIIFAVMTSDGTSGVAPTSPSTSIGDDWRPSGG